MRAHAHKEEIKVGYNLTRKAVLMAVWAISPLLFLLSPTAFGLCRPHAGWGEFARHVGVLWFAVGTGGLLFRTVQLFFTRDVRTGLVWAAKIVTDPFHDVEAVLARAVRAAARGTDRPGPARRNGGERRRAVRGARAGP